MGITSIVRLSRRRRVATVAACGAYAVVFAWASESRSLVVHLGAPAAAIVVGYWLSGVFFDRPQPRVERWLLRMDRRVCAFGGCRAWPARAPRWALEGLEATYATVYLVIAAGALLQLRSGVEGLVRYWTLVLAADLACYVALPWIRTRPPRTIEPPGPLESRPLTVRRFNHAMLHTVSVQVNTLPSGHVAGAAAASLAVMTDMPRVGAALLAVSTLIGVSAFLGRYHYFLDVVLGGAVALVAAALL